jgi:hypothetical protein
MPLPWYTNAAQPFTPGHGLGARRSIVQNPFARVASLPSVFPAPFVVNSRLDLPRQYLPKYDQGSEGACVGFAWSWAMSILNHRFYAARKLYLEAQLIDEWTDTPPEQGTSVTAGARILRDQGHWRFARGLTFPLALFEGIETFASAITVDEVRAAIAQGKPVVFALPWFANFDAPIWGDFGKGGPRWWIGRNTNLGAIRGWHAICCFGCRDDIQAAVLVNSWGVNYPIVNMPYETVTNLFQIGAEATIPVDRI